VSKRGTHQAAATVNARTATELATRGGDSTVWVPTLWFYVAVQLIEAALADHGLHLKEHGDRLAHLAGTLQVRDTASYKQLQVLSTQWRYFGRRPAAEGVERAEGWARDVATSVGANWPLT